MNIGVNTLFYIPGKVGGSETYLKETLRELAQLHDGEITLFTNRDNDALLRSFLPSVPSKAKFSFCLLDFSAVSRVSRILREQFQLPARIRKAKCDVLWSPGYTSCLLTGCPQVVSVLDMQYRRFPADLTLIARTTTDILVRAGVRKCRRIIAISEFSKSEIIIFTSAKSDKIDVSPLGVSRTFLRSSLDSSLHHCGTPGQIAIPPAAECRPDTAGRFASNHRSSTHETREKGKCAACAPYILCVAGSYPHKNLPALVEAFSTVAAKTEFNLILVGGKGLGEKALQSAIEASPFKDRISRAAGLAPAELADLYTKASMFVLPSLYEGFGLPVIEAQLAGVPVVTTTSASIPEVAGDAAVFCDGSAESLADAILRVADMTDAERSALVAKGIANASRFTWRNCAELTLKSLKAAVCI